MNKGKAVGKQVVSGVMSFLLSLFLTMAVLLPVLYFTAFSTNAFTRAFVKAGTYQDIYDTGMQAATATLRPTGFSPDILEGVFTVDDVHMVLDGIVDGTFDIEEHPEMLEAMKTTMLENMYTYMDDNDIPREIITEGDLKIIANTISREFIAGVSFPMIGRIRGYMNTYQTMMVIGVIVCLALSVLLYFLLQSLSIWKHALLRNLAFATGGAAAMLLVFPAGLLIWGGYNRISVLSAIIKRFVQALIESALWTLVGFGVAMLAVTILLAILSEKGLNSKAGQRKNRHKEQVGTSSQTAS